MPSKSNFESYPFLTNDEFYEACHQLERRYCQATLGPVRRRWRLRVCTALDTNFDFDGGYNTYIQITRPLEEVPDDGDLSACLGGLSVADAKKTDGLLDIMDRDMIDAEDDEEALHPHPQPDFGHVIYEILLHPTYRAPCLWFSLHNLPATERAFNIDTVFRRLVPDHFKDGLRTAGGIGGISAAHHPITGVPCFFVHPCLLGEAMSNFDCSRENYLMVWLGLVGGCVGLWIPKEMAMDDS
ncbi:autophagy-like protein 3 [Zalerion maritima]|uniref:Ubiquitin-like-conjugating enzyme ATG10 n=1 Tax=Zalerion maritima TaxID=339359 RepID=A0AAD5RXI7_9PEZI|nr:autophagy-like protein 3 [Zalerion maritima]